MLTMPVACGKNILEKGRDVKFLKQSKHFPTLQSSEPNNTTILSSTRHESTKPKHTKPNHNLDMHLFVKNKNNKFFLKGQSKKLCKFVTNLNISWYSQLLNFFKSGNRKWIKPKLRSITVFQQFF